MLPDGVLVFPVCIYRSHNGTVGGNSIQSVAVKDPGHLPQAGYAHASAVHFGSGSGHGRYQRFGVGMFRGLIERFSVTDFHNFAEIHDCNTVADMFNNAQVRVR